MLLYWSIDQVLYVDFLFLFPGSRFYGNILSSILCNFVFSNFKSFCQLLYNQSHVSQLLPFGSWRSFCLVEGLLTVEKMGFNHEDKMLGFGVPLPNLDCIYSWRNRHWKIGFWQVLKFEHKPWVASADSEEVHEFLLPLF